MDSDVRKINTELISIVIPVYNVEKYLCKCIDSILNQTYYHLQIICVNDGSKDKSGQILDEYAKKDSRIQVFHKKNGGVSKARNFGMEQIQGEYFAFVDPDDWIEADMYEQLLNIIKNENSDIAGCSYFIEENENSIPIQNKQKITFTTTSAKEALKYIYARDVYKAFAGYFVTRLYRTSAFCNDKMKICFDEDIYYGEGILFLTRAMLQSKRISFIPNCLYHYVQNDASAMHNYERRLSLGGSLKSYSRIIELLSKNKVSLIVLMWVKRFYVYLATVLVDDAKRVKTHQYDGFLKKEINRYIVEYVMMNLNSPRRILRLIKLKRWLK